MSQEALAHSRRSSSLALVLTIGAVTLRLDKAAGCLVRDDGPRGSQSTPLLWSTVDLLEVLFDQHPRPIAFAEICRAAWPRGLSGAAVRMAEFEAGLALAILGCRLVGSERDGLAIAPASEAARQPEPPIARAGRLLYPAVYVMAGTALTLNLIAWWLWWRS